MNAAAILRFTLGALGAGLLATSSLAQSAPQTAQDRATQDQATQDGFGVYPPIQGEAYSRYERRSLYVPTRDGTRLAVDVFRPMNAQGVEARPLPVIFYYARYWRARRAADGAVQTNLGVLMKGQSIGPLTARDSSGRLIFWDTGRESVPELMRRGYIFVRVEGRGAGASEGVRLADFTKQEAQDGADMIDWIAKQPFSNGKVGMIGGSYPGIMQLNVAAEAPPALKAIFPAAPAFDLYRLATGGAGVLHKGMLGFSASQARSDGLEGSSVVAQLAPVDADPEAAELAKILKSRAQNTPPGVVERAVQAMAPDFSQGVAALAQRWGVGLAEALGVIMDEAQFEARLADDPQAQAIALKSLTVHRDAPAFTDPLSTGRRSPHLLLPQLNAARIPTYVWSGWYDMDTSGAALLARNLTGPTKLTIGPWSHGPNEDSGRHTSPLVANEAKARELLTAEAIRWFDYWLKGVDTGVMSEPKVHVGYTAASGDIAWRAQAGWPQQTSDVALYLGARGGLADKPGQGAVRFTADYTKTLGRQSRYHDSFSGAPEMAYRNLNAHAEGGALSFETAPLSQDLLVVGHPIIEVAARSSAADGDLFFTLEAVGADGEAAYVTEAVMRASHRKPGAAPYDAAGLPYALATTADAKAAAAFNAAPAVMKAEMQPTAYRFAKGSRIRLVVTAADADNYITTPLTPAPALELLLGEGSVLRLPKAMP
ncbi:CocE/NonD family hydrolase [Caulobacter segnis]|uniref:CocE/NonD family hydrolase n=1 Tax=Caulobacter segnis TaxID=88688 RepID=UPI00240F7D0E|nr:CocE/NonD family hydrolase [Caulobacter segnis]MDG2521223.1 CocE/NonD family hydrolase [Caulobacter segnis]